MAPKKYTVKLKLSATEASQVERIIHKYIGVADSITGGLVGHEQALMSAGAVSAGFIELANIILQEVAE